MIPVSISDSPEIPNSVKTKLNIKQKELTRIKQWVVLNKQVLIDYADGKITTSELYKRIKPLED